MVRQRPIGIVDQDRHVMARQLGGPGARQALAVTPDARLPRAPRELTSGSSPPPPLGPGGTSGGVGPPGCVGGSSGFTPGPSMVLGSSPGFSPALSPGFSRSTVPTGSVLMPGLGAPRIWTTPAPALQAADVLSASFPPASAASANSCLAHDGTTAARALSCLAASTVKSLISSKVGAESPSETCVLRDHERPPQLRPPRRRPRRSRQSATRPGPPSDRSGSRGPATLPAWRAAGVWRRG
jgi:hypothetical protein